MTDSPDKPRWSLPVCAPPGPPGPRRRWIRAGRTAAWVGLMLVTFPLFIVGLSTDNLDWKLRGALITGGSAILVGSLIFSVFSNLW